MFLYPNVFLCFQIYCTNCYKMKIEIEAKNEDDSPEGQCENCDQLFQISESLPHNRLHKAV